VKLLGDFDGWSRGVDLSAEDTAGDSVFTRFTSTLLLPKVRRSKAAAYIFGAKPIAARDHRQYAERMCVWVLKHGSYGTPGDKSAA